MSNADEQIQYNCYLIFGLKSVGKTCFIKQMSGQQFERNIQITDDGFADDLEISQNQQKGQFSFIKDNIQGQQIQKYTCLDQNKIFYEINLKEQDNQLIADDIQKQHILDIINNLNKLKEGRIKIIYMAQFSKKNIKIILDQINIFFQGIISDEQFWSAYSNYFELVFSKLWDHNIQSLLKYFKNNNYLEDFQIEKRTSFFKKDGKFVHSETFLNLNLICNLNFFLISNFLDLSNNYLQDNIIDQNDDSQILVENYKILSSSINKDKDKQKLLKYLRFMCLKAKQCCYEYNFRESEEILNYIMNHNDDIQQNENLYYQYQDTKYFFQFMKKQFQTNMRYNGAQLQNVIIDETELDGANFQNNIVQSLNNTILELKQENKLLRKKTELNQKMSEQNNQVITNLQNKIEDLQRKNSEKIELKEQQDNYNQIEQLKEMIKEVQLKNNNYIKRDSLNQQTQQDTVQSHKASEFSTIDQKDQKIQNIFKSIEKQDAQEFKNLISKKKKFYILKKGDKTLFQAVQETKNKELIQILQNRIKEYVKINIVECGLKNHLPKIRALLFAGVKVDFQDFQGRTALMTATKKGDPITLEFLIQAGADINMKDNDGFTPLIWSINYSNLKSLNFLIQFEANINDRTNSGMTALMWASNFVQNGADIFAEDNNHRNALSLAQKKNHTQVIDYLEQQIKKKQNKENVQQIITIQLILLYQNFIFIQLINHASKNYLV